MKYNSFTSANARQLSSLFNDETPNITDWVKGQIFEKEVSSGNEELTSEFRNEMGRISGEIKKHVESFPEKSMKRSCEICEAEYAPQLHRAIKDIPVEVLADRDFWRSVTVEYLLPLAVGLSKGKPTTIIGSNNPFRECLSYRMFMMARICGEDSDLLTGLADGQHDFWMSHLVSASNGSEENGIGKALVEFQTKYLLPVNTNGNNVGHRVFVRDHLNGVRATIATVLMSGDEASSYLESVYNDPEEIFRE